jgi:hypothetical protein
LLKEQQERIKNKIEEREHWSRIASEKALNLKNYEKDELVRKNEGDTFFLHRPRHDPVLERSKKRNVENEHRIQKIAKHIKSEKQDVVNYYDKCVE